MFQCKLSLTGSLLVALSTCQCLNAQVPISTVAATGLTSSGADVVVAASQFNHIQPSTNGGSFSFDWVHATRGHFMFVAGASHQLLTQTHWTLGHGGVVWFHSRWVVEGNILSGRGSSSGVPFNYNDYTGTVTYRLSQHLYPSIREEYINIATSHGSLIRAGLCVCGVRRYSTTFYAAHSAGGNLGTEYISIREETARRLFEPFTEVSIGKSLPTLLNPALGIYSPSAHLFSVSGGARLFPLRRQNVTPTFSYARSGQSTTVTVGLAVAVKLRGD